MAEAGTGAAPQAVVTVDAIGLLCPLPVLKARKVLESLPSGQLVEVLTTDGMALIDLPHFCTTAGHDYLSMREAEGHHVHLIRRG